MLFDSKERSVNEFARNFVKLDAPTIVGLAKLLQVELFYPDIKDEKGYPMPRSGEAIIEDCIVKFYSLNREDRKRILKLTK
jgi:hypothetical protein